MSRRKFFLRILSLYLRPRGERTKKRVLHYEEGYKLSENKKIAYKLKQFKLKFLVAVIIPN